VALPRVDPEAKPSLLMRAVVAFSTTDAGTWYVRNVSPRIDPTLHRVTRGRASSILATPVVMLTAKGARSGEPRTTPLIYFTDGDDVILIASNYGKTRHPAWYHNVKANPEVTLAARGRAGRYRAREATGPERERLWALTERFARTYGRYKMTAGARQIPVMVLSPVAESGES
jgi:deazaflavin-dependent oxidoreductase (nitroreductase family)